MSQDEPIRDDDLSRRLDRLRADGWRAEGPDLEVEELDTGDVQGELVRWRMTLTRPGEQPLKGRGASPDAAAEAALARAEAIAAP
ncbi:MAG TPA: hypothetical protein VNT51_09810 [Miltoncostaeaceae bacterium]|nr:hypothetical protein [Miltoncostaeaceae bacterium]